MIDDGPTEPAPEKFVASKYSSGKVIIIKFFPSVSSCSWFLKAHCIFQF